MKFTLTIALMGSLALVEGALVPYAQCGGPGWKYDWVCPADYSCIDIPSTLQGSQYRCQPNSGPVWTGSREWGQCGGQGWTGPTKCPPGWQCNRQNDFFSTCGAIPGYEWPPSSTPGLAAPGDYCGPFAGENQPFDCVPGYICTEQGKINGYCLLNTSASTTSAVPSPTTLVVVTTTVIKTTTVSATPTKEYPPTTKSVKTTPPPPPATTKSVQTSKSIVKTTTMSKAEYPGVPPWGICGGNNHTGSTKCTEGWTCVRLSEWFSQCLKK